MSTFVESNHENCRMDINKIEPTSVWENFSKLNAVPRPSKKEERVIGFMLEFGNKLGLETISDEVGNVIIRKPATEGMEGKKMITLQHVAEVTNLDIEEVRFLNPSYKKDVIPFIEDENYVLRLPVDAVGKFVSNEQAIYAYAEKELEEREKPLPELFEQKDIIRYRVRSGDYLGKIAEKYGVSVSSIKRWNGLRSNRLRIGQRLTIHPRTPTSATASSSGSSRATTTSEKSYTVKTGDTLWSISKKFPGVTVDNLKKWNDIGGTQLKPGMKLKIQKS